MMDDSAAQTREKNQRTIEAVFERISTGRHGEVGPFLTDEIYFELPYGPGAKAIEVRGREAFLALNAQTWPAFESFRLEITQVHAMLDPDRLILEYRSEGSIIATGKPYVNRYVGIFGFEGGLICEWHEFHNPDVPAEAFRPDP